MIKAMKSILASFIILVSFFFSITQVSANSISKIDMDVYLDLNGNATITEVWSIYLSQGTEAYKSYTKLGNSEISNFTVSDDSGRVYDSLSYWNTSASFDSKAYKSGIHNIPGGIELCWGLSSYGNRTYTLKYDISNFVTQYIDTQGVYFNFLKLNQSVGSAKITVHSDLLFSLDNARIWSFGNNGSIYFDNGSIVLESGGNLSSSQSMVALIRFQSNLFHTNNISNSSFDSIYDSAFSDVVDSTHNNKGYGSKGMLLWIILIPLYLIFNPVVWIIAFLILGRLKGKNWLWGSGKYSNQLDFGQYGKILPSDSQINYWREIPCNKDLIRAYWVCSQYGVCSDKTLRQGIIGAILLKWIRNGYVTVSKTKKGFFNFKDNHYAIDFTKMTHADNEVENSLFEMLISASGYNRILEAKEFSKWSKKNYSKVNSWFSTINYKEQEYLEQQGLITNSIEETQGMFGRKKMITIKNVNPKLREDAIQLKGLKKFLLDFSMLPEREYFEVHIWEEYLIFAQLLGIADKVEEQFSRLYPHFNQETLLNTEITTIAVRGMAEICYEGVQRGLVRASRDYSGTSRHSGGGGSSYSSGGSSSGGSSGGGIR